MAHHIGTSVITGQPTLLLCQVITHDPHDPKAAHLSFEGHCSCDGSSSDAITSAAAAAGLISQTYELASEVAVMFSVSHLNIVQVRGGGKVRGGAVCLCVPVWGGGGEVRGGAVRLCVPVWGGGGKVRGGAVCLCVPVWGGGGKVRGGAVCLCVPVWGGGSKRGMMPSVSQPHHRAGGGGGKGGMMPSVSHLNIVQVRGRLCGLYIYVRR